MVQMKSVPDQGQIAEVVELAVNAVRIARHMYGSGKLSVVEVDPDLRSASARRAGITRARNELDGYCPCGECLCRYAEEIALARAKLDLEFRDFRNSLLHLQERMTQAKERADQAVNLLRMQGLLSVCPEQ